MSFSFSTSSPAQSKTATTGAPATGALFGTSTPSTSSPNLFGGQSSNTGAAGFSFGKTNNTNNNAAPASSNTGGASLFGSTGAKPTEQKPLFGAASGASTSTPTGGSGTLFGGSQAPTSSSNLFGSGAKPASSGSLFGNTTSTPTTTAANPSSSTPANAFSGGLFGAQKENKASTSTTGAPASQPGVSFGNAGGSGTSLFAPSSNNNATTGAATPAKPLFNLGGSTTPAGAPPTEAPKPASGSLFGNTTSQQGAEQKGNMSSVFANLGASKPATQPPASTGAPSPFSNTSQVSKPPTNLFAAPKPADGSSAPSSLLGGNAKPNGGASTSASMFAPKASTAESSGAAPTTSGNTLGGQPPKPAGNLFGGANTTASKPTEAPASTNSPFASLNKPAESTGATSSAPAQPSALFGGLNKPTSSATSEPAKPASSLFGQKPSTTSSTGAESTPASTAAAATTTAPAGSSAFGGAAKPAAASTATPNATGTGGNLGASTTGPTSSLARLKNKTMDEIITRWATDLSKYQKEFKSQADQVAAWDRLLVENGEKIQKLYLDTFEADKASREVERHLVTVESQQEELESWLDKYEGEVDQLFAKDIGHGEQLAGPDQEREKTYKTAEKVTERLDEMGRDLTKMIKEINDISGTLSKGNKPDDPLSQIVRVLNGHLSQLQWIDTNAAALQAKITAAQKASSTVGSHYGGPDNDAADSFYRSYMSRR